MTRKVSREKLKRMSRALDPDHMLEDIQRAKVMKITNWPVGCVIKEKEYGWKMVRPFSIANIAIIEIIFVAVMAKYILLEDERFWGKVRFELRKFVKVFLSKTGHQAVPDTCLGRDSL